MCVDRQRFAAVTPYWVKGPDESEYREVTCAEYVAVERRHGFNNTLGKPDEPATATFTAADGTRGTTLQPERTPLHVPAVPGFDPGHHFYDHLGNKITLEQWASLREGEHRVLRQTAVTEETALVTVYLGFVDPHIYDARLFGTARITDSGTPQQIQVYDSEVDALAGHFAHEAAMRNGYHCARCKDGQLHD